MFLRKIEFRNIGSYGNKITTLEFPKDGCIIQLKGRSGSGKSTLLSLPTLLYYGKLNGVNKSQVANRTNQHGWIRGEINHNGSEYVIERSFQPNDLKIYKDGRDVETVGAKDGQDYIEENIINIPFQIFGNVVSLNLNTFKSFVSMTASEKKQIIDNIFNLDMVNTIHDLVRKDMRDKTQQIQTAGSIIDQIRANITTAEEELNNHKEVNEREREEEKQRLTNEIEKATEEFNEVYGKINSIKSQSTKYVEAKNLLTKGRLEVERNIKEIEKKIQLFNEDKCPLCHTPFDTDNFEDVRERLNKAAKKEQNSLTEVKDKEDKVDECVRKFNDLIQEQTNKLNDLRMQLTRHKVTLNGLNNLNESQTDGSAVTKMIDRYKDEVDRYTEDIGEKKGDMEVLSILEQIYGKDGVKKTILGNYIPYINTNIKDILIKLSFPYDLQFTDEFDTILTYLGEEIPISTLSTGERKRVDIAVLCVILKLIKHRYPSINILYLDETLSSLDLQTSNEVIKYLKGLSEEMKMTIIIVSHNQLNSEYIDRDIMVTKTGGFSELSEETY